MPSIAPSLLVPHRLDGRTLEAKATEELLNGDVEAAFRFVDRRCRISPPPGPHCYVLRAEALNRMGKRDLAISDLLRALSMAPDDILANRRMLAWTRGPEQVAAALTLARHDHDQAVQRQALDILRSKDRCKFAHIRILHRRIEGWAIWDSADPVDLTITDGVSSVARSLVPDPAHLLRGSGSAASFSVPRPPSGRPQTIDLSVAGRLIASSRAAPRTPPPTARSVERLVPNNSSGVTVVLPVYGDYDATRACVESLVAVLRESTRHRAILVNDATPDPEISDHLAGLASEPRIEVLTNARNLGFVGSINRALEEIPDGDVVFLNADTLVPDRFLDRLAAAARSSPGIGTVTPLSNNGEFTSFPMPNKANPLPSLADVRRLNEAAARANAGVVIEIPSGIGFCLYVTRACLEVTGSLSEDYHRGYLEDVDFCLRARQRGLRNVCAPSVYVGHAGSRSFALEKRALVVRNLDVLERRFPTHRSECAAFMAADPLRAVRENIERLLPPTAKHPRILIATAGALSDVAKARARQLARAAQSAIIFELEPKPRQSQIRIFDAAGAMPQSLRLNLSSPRNCAALMDYLERLSASRVELFDPVATPDLLLKLFTRSRTPVDLFIADVGLQSLVAERDDRAVPERWPTRAPANGDREDAADQDGGARRRAAWRKAVQSAEQILVPSSIAEAFAAAVLGGRPTVKVGERRAGDEAIDRQDGAADRCHLGIVPVCASMSEQRLIEEIARTLLDLRPDVSIVVLGAVANQGRLMHMGHVFVTGRIEEQQFEQCVEAYGVGRLMIALDRPVFGHPVTALAYRCALPTAYVDWSLGKVTASRHDFAIDPRSSFADVMDGFARWLPSSANPRLGQAS